MSYTNDNTKLLIFVYSSAFSTIVNNAGIGPQPALIHETPEDTGDKVMTVNARSVFLGCKYAVAQILKQEPHPSGDRGWIINMASVAGIVGVPMSCKFNFAILRWICRSKANCLIFL